MQKVENQEKTLDGRPPYGRNQSPGPVRNLSECIRALASSFGYKSLDKDTRKLDSGTGIKKMKNENKYRRNRIR